MGTIADNSEYLVSPDLMALLNSCVTNAALSAALAQYATSSALSTVQAMFANYETLSGMSVYEMTTALTSLLNAYATTTAMNAAIAAALGTTVTKVNNLTGAVTLNSAGVGTAFGTLTSAGLLSNILAFRSIPLTIDGVTHTLIATS